MGQTTSAFQAAIALALDKDDELYAFPSEPFYDQDHVKRFNLSVKTTPLAVVYPKTAQQISNVIKVANEHNLTVQGKCGGHSYANFSSPDGGIVVDLKHFQKFEINTTTWQCKVGGGTKLGDLTRRMYEPHRRAMAHGVCPGVGIGGHATIGGLGPSSRLWGSALDHVEEVEIVVASGDIVRANEKENSDLFWAVRGAGASFGIITEFVVRTEPAPEKTIQYSYSHTFDSWQDLAKTFRAWQKYVSQSSLSRNFASTATITELGLTISVTFYGTDEEFDALNIAKEFPGNQASGTLVFDDYLGVVINWAETMALKLFSDIPTHAYTKTLTFDKCDEIPEAAIDRMFQYFEKADTGSLLWFAIFDLAGGKVNDISQDATAYAHRDALFYLQSYIVNLTGPVSKKSKKFLQGLNEVIKTGLAETGETLNPGAYPGYVDLELGAGAQKAYWGTNLPRLEQVKTKWDPSDVFHNPQSVRPGGIEVRKDSKSAITVAPNLLERLKARFH